LSDDITESTGQCDLVGIEMFRPSRLYTVGDKLIVFDDVDKDMFKVFNLPSLDYAYSYGSHGGGPGEFSRSINKECINVIDDCLEIAYLNTLMRFRVTDSTFVYLEPGKAAETPIPSELIPLNNFKKIDDTKYVANNDEFSNDKELCCLDIKNGEMTLFGDFSAKESQMSMQEKFANFAKSVCANQQAGRFAALYNLRPLLKIYDKDLNLLSTVKIEHEALKSIGDKKAMYFTDSSATPDHIYTMWIGKTKDEAVGNIDAFRPEILIFNWDGSLAGRMKLDRPVITFAVSESNGKLYAVSFDEADANKIFSYSLPEGL